MLTLFSPCGELVASIEDVTELPLVIVWRDPDSGEERGFLRYKSTQYREIPIKVYRPAPH